MADNGEKCVAAVEGISDNLTSAEAYSYFVKASRGKLQLSNDPPVLPKAGSIFFYDLGLDSKQWELTKRKLS